ncbi:MAG: hypothetical protein ABFD89_24900 [Bryobacteraceae bacterium]
MRWKRVALAAIFLFLLNLWIASDLLHVGFIDQMGSIEGTQITLGRWVRDNWGDLNWFPLWYGGVPYRNTYLPLHSWVVGLVSAVGDLPVIRAYRLVTAGFYSLGPVFLLLLAARLSRSAGAGFLAGLLYSMVSPSAFLISAVRDDVGSVWNARRLQGLVHYGEGPHLASMTLLPLALLLVIIALEKRRRALWLPAALGLVSVALTNWLGAVSLSLAVIAWLCSDDRIRWNDWLRTVCLGVFAYAIACTWLPPSTVFSFTYNERYVSGCPPPNRWIYIALAVIVFAAIRWLLNRLDVLRALRFAILFLFPLAAITFSAEWLQVPLMPQGNRYHLEMEMALVLAAVLGAQRLMQGSARAWRIAAGCIVAVLCVYPAVRYRAYAKQLIRPIDVTKRIEYREAQWFERNMKGGRVLAPGSVCFFLNVFSSTPQYIGGSDQAHVNPVFPGFHYQILSSENAGSRDGEVAVLALKAFGVDAVSVSGPGSQEMYKPFRNPKKFDGLLRELWRDGDDVIYDVGRRSKSLAHVIRPGDLPRRTPIHGLDVDPIRPYVAALEDPSLPLAEMRWLNYHTASISASMRPDQVLSVQVSYHPGWHASVSGRSIPVTGDAIGQIVVAPRCEGRCQVELVYDGGLERKVTQVVSWIALLAGMLFTLSPRRKRHSAV